MHMKNIPPILDKYFNDIWQHVNCLEKQNILGCIHSRWGAGWGRWLCLSIQHWWDPTCRTASSSAPLIPGPQEGHKNDQRLENRLRQLGLFSLGRQGSGEILLLLFSTYKEFTRKVRTNYYLAESVVLAQGVMFLNWKSIDLD